jgi:hypothetical protein
MPRKSKVNKDKVLQLMNQGVAQSDIAKQQDVEPSTIYRFMKHLPVDIVAEYKAKRSDMLTMQQIKSAAVIDRALDYVMKMDDSSYAAMPDDKKIGFANVANNAGGTAFDKEMVETGKISGDININVLFQLVAELPKLQAEIAAYEAEFVVDQPTNKEIASPDRQPDAE